MGQWWAWAERFGPAFLPAAGWTLLVAAAASLGALLWGTALFFVTLAGGPWGARLVSCYVQLLRNIPVLLPIYLIYFGFPLIGLAWSAAVCGGLALVLQNGAYVAEIFRGSYKAIDRVQHDAGKSLGLSRWMGFRKIVLPQVLVHALPALGNQTVLLLKDTSLLSAIALVELTMQAKVIVERTGTSYAPFMVAAGFYLAMVAASELLFRAAHRSVRWR
jgi:His/Glu/Gln/Arg/opine family amino acid ABC transporter permease subunit